MGEAPDIREQEDCPSRDVCGGGCDQHGTAARYDHERREWLDVETGAVVASEPDAAWIVGGLD